MIEENDEKNNLVYMDWVGNVIIDRYKPGDLPVG